MDYVVDTSEDKRFQLIRYIANEANGVDGASVYIFPTVVNREYGINLETIQAGGTSGL